MLLIPQTLETEDLLWLFNSLRSWLSQSTDTFGFSFLLLRYLPLMPT